MRRIRVAHLFAHLAIGSLIWGPPVFLGGCAAPLALTAPRIPEQNQRDGLPPAARCILVRPTRVPAEHRRDTRERSHAHRFAWNSGVVRWYEVRNGSAWRANVRINGHPRDVFPGSEIDWVTREEALESAEQADVRAYVLDRHHVHFSFGPWQQRPLERVADCARLDRELEERAELSSRIEIHETASRAGSLQGGLFLRGQGLESWDRVPLTDDELGQLRADENESVSVAIEEGGLYVRRSWRWDDLAIQRMDDQFLREARNGDAESPLTAVHQVDLEDLAEVLSQLNMRARRLPVSSDPNERTESSLALVHLEDLLGLAMAAHIHNIQFVQQACALAIEAGLGDAALRWLGEARVHANTEQRLETDGLIRAAALRSSVYGRWEAVVEQQYTENSDLVALSIPEAASVLRRWTETDPANEDRTFLHRYARAERQWRTTHTLSQALTQRRLSPGQPLPLGHVLETLAALIDPRDGALLDIVFRIDQWATDSEHGVLPFAAVLEAHPGLRMWRTETLLSLTGSTAITTIESLNDLVRTMAPGRIRITIARTQNPEPFQAILRVEGHVEEGRLVVTQSSHRYDWPDVIRLLAGPLARMPIRLFPNPEFSLTLTTAEHALLSERMRLDDAIACDTRNGEFTCAVPSERLLGRRALRELVAPLINGRERTTR